jgi:hypothetical protein
LILFPAVITLGVTLLRLVGELQGWSPRLFSRAPGGAAALVGIVWLVPIFGAWFGWRLVGAGDGPAGAGRAAGWALLAFFGHVALVAAVVLSVPGPVPQLGILFVTSWAMGFVARRGWPALWDVLLAYAFAARLPVLAIMALSIFGHWDTHYAKPRPDFPPMAEPGLFFWTALLPQLGIWIWFTLAVGGLFGAVAAAFHPARRRRREGTPAAA